MHAIGNQLGVAIKLEAKDGYFIADLPQHGFAGDNLLGRGCWCAFDADHHINSKWLGNFAAAVIEVKIDDILADRRTAAIAHFIV